MEKSIAMRDTTPTIGDKMLKGVANLIKLLPTGTVFLFQFLSPLLTNKGNCHTINRYLSGALLFLSGFSCCFSCFTDSYVGNDGKIYYGIVTKDGLWSFTDPNASKKDLSQYKLRFGDFVHAFLSLIVFAVIAMLDSNTVHCFYPSFEAEGSFVIRVAPTVVGGLASVVSMVFPNKRHWIGYPATEAEANSA